MELSEGMVAVVRGLPEAGLAVSLLDGSRQYTLMPNTAHPSLPAYVQVSQKATPPQMQSASTEVCQDTRMQGAGGVHNHSGAQVVDGRYASVYKMAHCNVQPTSPPVLLTEFPPQRAELCPGQGNFVVGGLGSGETSFSPTRNGSFRGAMNWPERGAVFSPRQSHEPDAFANSLRKYPNLSPERSAEMVERLINYTQMKNVKNQIRSQTSPMRCESNSTTQGQYDRRSCITASMRTQRAYEPEVNLRPKIPDDSPTRDNARKYDYESFDYKRSLFGRNYDVRYLRDLRDMNRRVKENIRNVSTYPYSHPVCPAIKERYDHLPPEMKIPDILSATNSVHMETQAEIPMVSREVSTVPREERPLTRNVAVPLSPSSSQSNSPKLHPMPEIKIKCSCKAIQMGKPIARSLQIRKSVQTCISSIDIPRSNKKKVKSCRKSKSQEELRVNDDLEDEVLTFIKDLSSCPDLDTDFGVRNGLLRKLRKLQRTDRSDKLKIKFGRCIRDQLYSEVDFKNFSRELSNELISKMKRHNIYLNRYNPANVFRAEVDPLRSNNEENSIDELIKEWLDDIPIKPLDYLGRHVNKDHVLQTVANKMKTLIINKVQHDCYGSLKPEIFDIIEDVPIEVNARNKMYYLNRIVDDLVKKIESICVNSTDRRRWKKAIDLNKSLKSSRKESFVCKHVQPTEDELKEFVEQELKDFTVKFHLKICPHTEEEIQVELLDLLIDSTEAIKYGNDEHVKEELINILADYIDLSQHEAVYFVNNLTCNLKDMFKKSRTDTTQQTFVVLQNSLQNSSVQTQNYSNDFSIEGIDDNDIQNNLDLYTQQLVQQINEWMLNIQALSGIDSGFKQVVANDLAGDIVDRHKYLELNPNCKGSDADELEHLKYQIFKWVNKLVGEDNVETFAQASELMRRIQNIPVPMLTRPIQNIDTGLPACCQKNVGPSNIGNYPSGRRRYSSPGQYDSHQPSSSGKVDPNSHSKATLPGKQYVGQSRRQSSPGAISTDQPFQCCNDQMPTNNHAVMTDRSLNKIEKYDSPPYTGISSIPRRAAFTETDAPQIRSGQWRSSVGAMEPPRAVYNRRFSGPGRYPSGGMQAGPANQTPVPASCCDPRFSSPRRASLDSPMNPILATPSIKQLNDDYDEYILNWVQQIPIVSSNPEEQALEQKMRQGIYNGVWKAITKLKMNPAILTNPFYYEDVLGDEIEELLNLLPPSQELTSKKYKLKSDLIEKTTNMNAQIVEVANSSSFKQKLVENIANSLPRKLSLDLRGQDVAKIIEDIHKLKLADEFIMYTMYKEDDRVKASVYRKKLMNHVQEFIDAVKKSHGKELKDIDFLSFKDEIIASLQKVPLPNDETIRAEANEILIGLEIESWFNDLPLSPTTDYVEILSRRRYRNTLARRVNEMEQQMSLTSCEEALRNEIKQFMKRLPLRLREEDNIKFMIEELVNRLKNRPKEMTAGGGRRRSVNFVDPQDYDEFSRNMQLCSSFSDAPDAKRAQINESSYMIVGGTRANDVPFPMGRFVQSRREDTPESQQQWLTIEEDVMPSGMRSGQGSQAASRQVLRQGLQTDQLPGGQIPPQANSCCQTPAPPVNIRDDIVGGQPQMEREPSFHQTMMREREQPHTSRMSAPRLPGTCPRQATIPDRRSPGFAASGFPGTCQGTSAQPCSSGRAPSPTLGPEGSTKPYEAVEDDVPSLEPQGRQFNERSSTQSPSAFSKQPIGFSTPQQTVAPPRESRPKKRTREIERPRREAARKRLDLEDSDDNLGEEMRCRCMERVWRGKKKRPICFDDFDMDFPPYFPMMRCPYPYYY